MVKIMEELKMGDTVEVLDHDNKWNNCIFIKHGDNGAIIFVNPDYEQDFLANRIFSTFKADKRYWRIKQKSEYVPFTWDDREQLRGKWVRAKMLQHFEYCLTYISHVGVGFDMNENIYYDRLFNNYEFIDGTPCGKIKQQD